MAIAVAYGVSKAYIRALNNMAPGDSVIWAGQRLLIVPAGVVTPTSAGALNEVASLVWVMRWTGQQDHLAR